MSVGDRVLEVAVPHVRVVAGVFVQKWQFSITNAGPLQANIENERRVGGEAGPKAAESTLRTSSELLSSLLSTKVSILC